METPVAQISNSSDDANNALIALVRLLGRQAAAAPLNEDINLPFLDLEEVLT